jgi:predicted Zn finger-like uncharacterized protein
MEVRCDKCQARYRVDDARIGPQGLTMRCGKCQNTFKVTRAAGDAAKAAPAAKPAAPAPAAAPADDAAGATMMFNVNKAPAAPAPKPAAPPAAKPAAPAPKPAPAAAPPADEGAGRTMMFNTGNLKSTSPGAKAPLKAEEGVATIVSAPNSAMNAPRKAPAGESESGSTMVFGQSPLAAQGLVAKPPVAKAAASDEAAGATQMFGTAPVSSTHTPATAVRPPKTDPGHKVDAPAEEAGAAPAAGAAEDEAPPAAEEPEATAPPGEEPAGGSEEAAGPETTQETSPDEYRKEAGIEAEGMEAAPEETSAFDKEPPKGIIIGVIAGVAVVVIALVVLLAVKKLGAHPPPQAVVDATLTSAESKAKQALDDAGPKAKYPEGVAEYARIEIQFADALADQAQIFSDKSGRETDAAKKAEDDSQVSSLAGQADAKLKRAYEVLTPTLKVYPDSPEVLLAFADYYRAKHASSNMNKFLKAAQSKKADEGRVAFIQGVAAEQEDDGAERAIPKLKAAAQANPASARIHYRLAVAYQAMKDEANARSEYNETLKIAPTHERAKAALDALGAGK